MKTRKQKIAELERLRGVFAEHPIVVLCSFQGIKVEQDFQLRSKIREQGAGYRVAPNRLMRLASEGTPFAEAMSKLKGMTSMVYAKDDPVGLMKSLLDLSKRFEVLSFKAGVVEGQELSKDGLSTLATMPGKAETQARILFLINSSATNLARQINAPAQNLVGVLNAPARDLVSVLKQAVDQGKFNGS